MTRVVAIDLGIRRIGVAVSGATDGTALAFPRETIVRSGDRAADHRAVAAVAEEVGAEVVVVGLPLSLDGRRGPAALQVAGEVDELARSLGHLGIRVETYDERFTTVTANAALATAGKGSRERRRSVDSAAAAVLLGSWLASR